MQRKNLNLWKTLQGVARTENVHFVNEYQIRSLVDRVDEKFATSIPLLLSTIYLCDISEELLQPLTLRKFPTICRE